MNGKLNAIGLTLLMIASALAGCTSGDPDGDGELGIDTDVLNQMIEDNLQDFINNSSVTVHQTIHYHNNTTYVDNSESNTNVGDSSGNGSSPTSIIQVMRIQQDFPGNSIDFGDIQFVQDGILQFPAIDFAPTMNYNLDGTTISMDFTCQEFINAAQNTDFDDWYGWARYDLNFSDSASYGFTENILNDISELWQEAREYCSWNSNNYQSFTEEVLRIDIPEGQAISFLQISHEALSEFNWTLICDDGYSHQGNSYSLQSYIGGWTDCQFIGHHYWSESGYWDYGYLSQTSQGTITPPTHNISMVPDWYDHSYWYSWTGEDGSSSIDWIFYYTTHFVVPLE